MNDGSSLVLRTPRLTLHPVAVEHAGALFPLMSDERMTSFLAWEPHTNPEETQKVLSALVRAQSEGAAYHWTVFEEDEVRGLISLIDVRRRHRSWTVNRAEIAYWVDPAHQGKGIATEATRAVVDTAFDNLGLNRLIVSHTSANAASGKIPAKLGFRFVGTERQFFCKGGVWHDMNHYEILAEDWRTL